MEFGLRCTKSTLCKLLLAFLVLTGQVFAELRHTQIAASATRVLGHSHHG